MIAPNVKNQITINLKDKVTSKPYIDITMKVMKDFGAKVKNEDYKKITISNLYKYIPQKYYIESDASNASYFMAAAAVTKSKIKILGLNSNSVQGDIKFLDILKKMGCKIIKRSDFIEIIGDRLKGIDIDMNEMPDLVPTLAVVALFAEGKTIIRNVQNLRFKECDRLSALRNELTKIGAKVKELNSGLVITPKELKPAVIETYNDHRIAMSFSIAGLKIDGIKINNPQCVKKSFPDYWKIFKNTFYSKL
jgi:3-phosphoshikimate 1-carboxyvinyltransferase